MLSTRQKLRSVASGNIIMETKLLQTEFKMFNNIKQQEKFQQKLTCNYLFTIISNDSLP